MVVCTPDWGCTGHGASGPWRRLLDRITVDRVPLPQHELFVRERDRRILPPPHWGTIVSILDGKRIRKDELDPAVVQMVKKMNKGLGLAELRAACSSSQPSMEPADGYLPPRVIAREV